LSTGALEENIGAVIKIGENEPCPCGSGKKFKRCCKTPDRIKIDRMYTGSELSGKSANTDSLVGGLDVGRFILSAPRPINYRPHSMAPTPSTATDVTSPQQEPKHTGMGDELRGKLLELLGWLALLVIGGLVWISFGSIDPFVLVPAFVFLFLVPVYYFLAKRNAVKNGSPSLNEGKKKISSTNAAKSASGSADSPAAEAVLFGFRAVGVIFLWMFLIPLAIVLVLVVYILLHS
jgi:SEC-C motif